MRTAAVAVVVSAAAVTLVGETGFASGHARPAHPSSSKLTKSQVDKLIASYVAKHKTAIVKSYIDKHLADIRGPQPQTIQSVTHSASSPDVTIADIGPWGMEFTL